MVSKSHQKSFSGLVIILFSLILSGCSTTRRLPETDQKIYVVIDDAGPNLKYIEAFLKLPIPLTVAILPGYPATEKTAYAIQNQCQHKELILHQPMEAENGRIDPGPGAIWADTPTNKIYEVLKQNTAQLPGLKGMNNHMGSQVTQNREQMEAIIQFCKENNLYFVDSFTTPDSIACHIAREKGVPTAQQQIFLDNIRDPEAIRAQFIKGMHIAREQGSVVMIGHAWSPETASVINQLFPVAERNGFSFHAISAFFDQKPAKTE